MQHHGEEEEEEEEEEMLKEEEHSPNFHLVDSPTRIPAEGKRDEEAEEAAAAEEKSAECDDGDGGDEDGDDFEFSFVQISGGGDPNSQSAGDIFADGVVRPMYPIFNHPHPYLHPHPFYSKGKRSGPANSAPPSPPETETETKPLRGQIRQLFLDEEKEHSSSSTSSSSSSKSVSSVEELDGIPPGTYCVWTPNSRPDQERKIRYKKSRSAGSGSSSLRWKLRDLVVGRSRSDGSGQRLFFIPIHEEEEKEAAVGRKSFLPYKQQDIVGGLFTNVNVAVNGGSGKLKQ